MRVRPYGTRLPRVVMLLCIAFEVKAEMVVALAGDIHLARGG